MKETDFLTQGTVDHTYGSTTSYNINQELYPTAFSVGYVKQENMPHQFLPTYYRATYTPTINAERLGEKYPNTTNEIYDIFYMGYNSSSAASMNGADVFETNGLAYCDQNGTKVRKTIGAKTYLYGKFNPLMATRPSRIQIVIRFCGTVSGSSDYSTGLWQIWWLGALSIQQLYDVIHGTTDYTHTHANMELKLSDFINKRYITRNDSNAIGVYSLSYSFEGWGRNSDGTGAYSYVFPAIGYLYGDLPETYEQAVTLKPDFSVVGGYGSAPYGAYARNSWGGGFRVRTAGGASYPTLYQEDGLQIYQAALNGSYASFDNRGYAYNVSGFICCAPVMPTYNTVMYNWDNSTINSYLDKITDDQSVIFTPQGRTDFAAMHQCANLQDVWKHAGLFPVWSDYDNRNAAAELNEHFWFAEMDGDEFLCNLIRGDDPALSDKTPAWILNGDSLENLYNPDTDRPVPSPEDPGEDDTRQRNDGTNLPSFDGIRLVSGTGFSTFYCLSSYHVAALGTYLSQMPQTFWEALGTATDYKMANILDFICGLKWYPLNLQASAPSLYPDIVTTEIQFGFTGTAAVPLTDPGTSYKLGTVNRIFDFGTIYIPYRSASPSFLDYEPYTDVYANLPFIGKVQLQANQVVGYQISCHYVVDLITGMCTCFLDNGFDTIFTGSGKIGVDITVFGNDVITQSERLTSGYINTATHSISNALSIGGAVSSADAAESAGEFTSSLSGIVADCIQTANAKRGVPQSVGGGSGFGSTYCDPYPVVIVNRPAVKIPAGYGHQNGYVYNAKSRLASLSGFTVCANPDLSGIAATSAELDMIRTILTSGFYA